MTIVSAELVFANDRWERRHAFAMQGGTILGTGEPGPLAEEHPGHDRQDWGDVAVVPGTVNGHAHSFRSLLRGLDDDVPATRRRDSVLHPLAERLDLAAIRAGALLAFAQMARAGVTTAVDVFPLHDRDNENAMAVVEAAKEVGIRLVLARSMWDWTGGPRRFQESPDEAERNFRSLHASLAGDRLAFVQPAPHSIHAASPEMIQRGAALAREFGVPLHVHVAEDRGERDEVLERTGLSPVAFLDSVGGLDARTVMTGCVWVDDRDLALAAERGARVVHRPGADANAGAGIAPVREMLAHGIPVCLGTGGGRQSIFDEMHTAVLLARAAAAEASALGADETFLMGTARAGEILGMPVGRIAADHAADLVVLDLSALSLQPSRMAPSQAVQAMEEGAIRRVLVGGEVVVEDGRLSRADEPAIVAGAREVIRGWSRTPAPTAT
jgi:5-methylthioadenosine/S-adenosylhomocysteine deaminase